MLKTKLNRRTLGLSSAAFAISACTASTTATKANADERQTSAGRDNAKGQIMSDEQWANLSESEWKDRLTESEFYVLRKEGTERAGTSPLNNEKRKGTYVCAGCGLPLFKSETKYESGTGWPSFYTYIDGALKTKVDRKLFMTRTEYHCARCGGHQGHVFEDGPRPTGLRYCNNGVALDFVENG
ncbi:peptide-methionine (R)-S-oxide reductase [Litorimonas taeanensis]|uniref:peptide-methionine (R)-S-oxide reductase n=1 Tax=Litorimonas taeanensis TaxID=568099 RepID=A0A420WE62_9PROT|nr:peptide-methionine (R)-S-oxide reductase MsrB [Litorimonas taeanensis]RKQ69283.1 peptide-methionine (R)-S-oxide reductase [Litorimonas taeanensis]